jgi:chromate transporter
MSEAAKLPRTVTLGEIFSAFLLIGATSFGGGVVAYLRSGLVDKQGWLDDTELVELLSISQTLPGLK